MYSANGSNSIEFRNSYTLIRTGNTCSDAIVSQSNTLMLSTNIDSQRENIALIEAALETVCQQAQIARERAFFITLATSEALCNIIEHGYSFEPGNPIAIAVHRTNRNTLEVSLEDSARQMDPELVRKLTSGEVSMPDTNTTLEQLPESNWGTNLITHATSEVRYSHHQGQNTLTLCFSL